MHTTVRGLVIRSVDYKEADKILTVLTEELGKITVGARGVRRKNSRHAAACQLFSYATMTLYDRQGRYTLTDSEVQLQFHGLSTDIDKLALASYLAELLGTEGEDNPTGGTSVRLAVNCLYALSRDMAPVALIKPVFELRYLAECGYRPALTDCPACGKRPSFGRFNLYEGRLYCGGCGSRPGDLPLDEGALQAARFLLDCPLKELFSFRLTPESLRQLSHMTERWLLTQMDRPFKTLDFYKSLST
jgi:DNA repair protein RecO (recombination protein O)